MWYAKKYDPLQAGSIDGTDTIPHDHAIARAQVSVFVKPTSESLTEDPLKTLFVGRLNPLTTEETLKKTFERFGSIKCARLVRNIITGDSRGYAFVEFDTENACQEAFKNSYNMTIDERQILTDYERGRVMEGWIPRRLGGGFGGRKESGQLRFGARDRPFKRPLHVTGNQAMPDIMSEQRFDDCWRRRTSSANKSIDDDKYFYYSDTNTTKNNNNNNRSNFQFKEYYRDHYRDHDHSDRHHEHGHSHHRNPELSPPRRHHEHGHSHHRNPELSPPRRHHHHHRRHSINEEDVTVTTNNTITNKNKNNELQLHYHNHHHHHYNNQHNKPNNNNNNNHHHRRSQDRYQDRSQDRYRDRSQDRYQDRSQDRYQDRSQDRYQYSSRDKNREKRNKSNRESNREYDSRI
ncbi:hypothetical protein Glove_279g39 [Diversispora epigaea]|uniref:RRM domain-containing protein n=1 Tax=Diversispora epigaea TaxID=1348612 RepID=A0A397I2K1_9GLOM|nr:hypothetical protein Glove_279g39 [Diversispora epigaea]